MELNIRATELHVLPSDTSGFLVRVECADAEFVREQVLRGPDDAADDWPLAKRYGEICDRAVAMEVVLHEWIQHVDALDKTLIAAGGRPGTEEESAYRRIVAKARRCLSDAKPQGGA